LIVDDEGDLVLLLEHALDAAGYAVGSARDGTEGLERIRSEVPDLVLLDVSLPGIDGLEICGLLARDPATRAVPVILITARGAAVDVFRGLVAGARDYLVKPFRTAELLARVDEALARTA